MMHGQTKSEQTTVYIADPRSNGHQSIALMIRFAAAGAGHTLPLGGYCRSTRREPSDDGSWI